MKVGDCQRLHHLSGILGAQLSLVHADPYSISIVLIDILLVALMGNAKTDLIFFATLILLAVFQYAIAELLNRRTHRLLGQ